jgi:hypothetical protein
MILLGIGSSNQNQHTHERGVDMGSLPFRQWALQAAARRKSTLATTGK